MRIPISLLTILVSVLVSCDKNHTPQHSLSLKDLKATWVFVKFIDKNTLTVNGLPTGYSATISFESNYTVDVEGPCNNGAGKFSINKDQVSITHLAMTERACDALNHENRITSNLSGIYTIEGNTLFIKSDFDTDLVFKRQ